MNASVDQRFGRCPFFIIVDPKTMEPQIVKNSAVNATSGSGIQAAQLLSDANVEAVLTGNIGPKAFQALSAAGIKVYTNVTGTVKEALKKIEKGELGRDDLAGTKTHSNTFRQSRHRHGKA
ncbi:MAG: NifB/NifX family molybdenum-iron cluster-binding protein [Candidatus Ranarchaeia archaeon]